MKTIRALIVDDEPLARGRLRRFLAPEKDIEIIGEAGDGRAAIHAAAKLKPDLMFLDIELPEAGGFQVLAAIPETQRPIVIFVTAYDQYAIKAFDEHALDYLLKPFDRARFSRAVERARQQLARGSRTQFDEQLVSLLRESASRGKYLQRFTIKASARIYFVPADDVEWISAEGNYVNLHVAGKTHLLRETMAHLEAQLDPSKFVRIHRSTIVNINRVQELRPLFSGDYIVVLKDGTQLNLSRAYREQTLKRFAGTT